MFSGSYIKCSISQYTNNKQCVILLLCIYKEASIFRFIHFKKNDKANVVFLKSLNFALKLNLFNSLLSYKPSLFYFLQIQIYILTGIRKILVDQLNIHRLKMFNFIFEAFFIYCIDNASNNYIHCNIFRRE